MFGQTQRAELASLSSRSLAILLASSLVPLRWYLLDWQIFEIKVGKQLLCYHRPVFRSHKTTLPFEVCRNLAAAEKLREIN